MIRSTLGPFNPNPKWPEGCVQVLREQGIDENQIPHFLRWVRGFFAQYKGSRRRDLGRREIETYLSQLAKKPRTYLWQVEQARQALEWYYEQFREIPLEPRYSTAPSIEEKTSSEFGRNKGIPDRTAHPIQIPQGREKRASGNQRTDKDIQRNRSQNRASEPPSGQEAAFWVKLRQSAIEAFRLEHYALRTERCYLGWIARYLAFHNWRNPCAMGEEEVRAFLTDLTHFRSRQFWVSFARFGFKHKTLQYLMKPMDRG